jgi:hypothetical protein
MSKQTNINKGELQSPLDIAIQYKGDITKLYDLLTELNMTYEELQDASKLSLVKESNEITNQFTDNVQTYSEVLWTHSGSSSNVQFVGLYEADVPPFNLSGTSTWYQTGFSFLTMRNLGDADNQYLKFNSAIYDNYFSAYRVTSHLSTYVLTPLKAHEERTYKLYNYYPNVYLNVHNTYCKIYSGATASFLIHSEVKQNEFTLAFKPTYTLTGTTAGDIITSTGSTVTDSIVITNPYTGCHTDYVKVNHNMYFCGFKDSSGYTGSNVIAYFLTGSTYDSFTQAFGGSVVASSNGTGSFSYESNVFSAPVCGSTMQLTVNMTVNSGNGFSFFLFNGDDVKMSNTFYNTGLTGLTTYIFNVIKTGSTCRFVVNNEPFGAWPVIHSAVYTLVNTGITTTNVTGQTSSSSNLVLNASSLTTSTYNFAMNNVSGNTYKRGNLRYTAELYLDKPFSRASDFTVKEFTWLIP